jgi:hypothetical protein
MNEGLMGSGGLGVMTGMNTYGQTLTNLNQREAALEKGFSQGLLDIEAATQIQNIQIAQESAKYGVSPAQTMDMLTRSTAATQQMTGGLFGEYQLGLEQIETERANLEFAKGTELMVITDKLRAKAEIGQLTQEDFLKEKEYYEIAYPGKEMD